MGHAAMMQTITFTLARMVMGWISRVMRPQAAVARPVLAAPRKG